MLIYRVGTDIPQQKIRVLWKKIIIAFAVWWYSYLHWDLGVHSEEYKVYVGGAGN